jgi:hypothetical protein
VPPVLPQTEEERLKWEQADQRRAERLARRDAARQQLTSRV